MIVDYLSVAYSVDCQMQVANVSEDQIEGLLSGKQNNATTEQSKDRGSISDHSSWIPIQLTNLLQMMFIFP